MSSISIRRVDERGMSTAEYAVGTLGACTVAAVLVTLGGSDWFSDLLQHVLRVALDPLTLFRLVHSQLPFTPIGR